MADFIIAYFGGDKPSSEEEGRTQMGKFRAWVEGLGDSVVNPGTPLMGTKIVSSDEVKDEDDPSPWNGYSIIKAENMDEAIEVSKSCPFLETNGTLRVAQLMEM